MFFFFFLNKEQWAQRSGCKKVIKRSWGSGYFDNISACRGGLIEWNRKMEVDKSRRKKEKAREIELLRPTTRVKENFDKLRNLKAKWLELLRDDADRWRQRAKEFRFRIGTMNVCIS